MPNKLQRVLFKVLGFKYTVRHYFKNFLATRGYFEIKNGEYGLDNIDSNEILFWNHKYVLRFFDDPRESSIWVARYPFGSNIPKPSVGSLDYVMFEVYIKRNGIKDISKYYNYNLYGKTQVLENIFTVMCHDAIDFIDS